ncbi:plasmid transfer protein TraA [Kitasatospora sp. NPDC096147]|uniref:plasmid transfer protein TraA n=1 Tax=Kitasatospora sp. NPDC096147 TaxID=3364093 RepID=UPI00380B5AEE
MTTSTPPASGASNTSNQRNSFGGGATFAPGININVSKSGGGTKYGAAANPGTGAARGGPLALPEPAFYSTADIREYCEALRAFTAYAAIEVEVGAEILKAALEQAPNAPGAAPFDAKLRARRVAKKVSKAADALADAAKLAAATYAAFQREYADVLTPRQAPKARRPFQF